MKIKELLDEIIEKAEKKPLNKPMQSDRPGKKKKVYVKDPSTGNVKTVHYGDTNYKHNYSDGAKKNFRARHNCSEKTDKTKPGYWACKDLWPTNKPAKKSEANMKKDQLTNLGFTIGEAPSLVKSEQSAIDTEKVSNHLPTRQGMEKSSRDRLDEQLAKGSVEYSTPTMMVILRTPKQAKQKQPRIEELDKQHGEEHHGKEMPMADVDYQVEEVERSLSKEEMILKALEDLEKGALAGAARAAHRYVARLGYPGHYQYKYQEDEQKKKPNLKIAPKPEPDETHHEVSGKNYSAKVKIKKLKNGKFHYHATGGHKGEGELEAEGYKTKEEALAAAKKHVHEERHAFANVDTFGVLTRSEKVEMPKEKFVAEHKKLVGVLESPSKKDDKKEAKEQKKELKEVDKGEKEGRCWEGYKPVKGKKPYSEGSCVKKAKEDEKFDFDGNKKLDAHEKHHKKIEKEHKKMDKSLDSLIEMLSDQSNLRKIKTVHENTTQRPQAPYRFVRSMGKGGMIFDFGNKTGNIFADKATELLAQNADPMQVATVKHQEDAYQKALTSFVETGKAEFEMQTSNEKKLEKGFDEQVKEAYENGTLYEDPSKPAIQNEFNKSQLKMNGEVIKATSETDAALIEMMQSQIQVEETGTIIDATNGGKQSVTVEC